MLSSGDLQFQVIAFLFEFIGLTLAFIEVRLPETAARIARFLGQLAAPIEDLRGHSKQPAEADKRLSKSLGKLLNTVLTIGTLPLIIIFIVKAIHTASEGNLTVAWLIPELIVFILQLLVVTLVLLMLALILYFTVVIGSDFATRFVRGRAVGTLGIMLAAIGFLMEFYQLVEIV